MDHVADSPAVSAGFYATSIRIGPSPEEPSIDANPILRYAERGLSRFIFGQNLMAHSSERTSRSSRDSCLVRGSAVAVALIACGVFTSQATASCGDWLADSNQNMASEHANLPLTPLSNSPVPAPCHGPFCQQAPVAPPPAVPVTSVERVDKLSRALNTLTVDPLAGPSSLLPELAVHPAKGFLPRIEHPPRV